MKFKNLFLILIIILLSCSFSFASYSETLVFSDDFDSLTGWSTGSGSFSVSGGILQAGSATVNDIYRNLSSPVGNDWKIEARIRVNHLATFGLGTLSAFGSYLNNLRGYSAFSSMSNSPDQYKIVGVPSVATGIDLSVYSEDGYANTWINFTLTHIGDNLSLYRNDVLLTSVINDSYSGNFEILDIYFYNNNVNEMDWIKVYSLSPSPPSVLDEYYIRNLTSRWYLNDSNYFKLVNETDGINDSWGSNNGQLYGKTFNHGTNNGASINNNLTGDITDASWGYDPILGRPALNFDGNGDYVDASLSIKNYPFTINGRFYLENDTSSQQTVATINDASSTSVIYGVKVESNKLRIFARNGVESIQSGNTLLEKERWYSFSAVFENETHRSLYLNGNLDASSTTSIPYNNLVDTLSIGKLRVSSPTQYMNGSISNILILDKALNANDVQILYETGNVDAEGYYHEINFPLDEGSGTKVYTEEGKFGGYYEFDGTSSYVEIEDSPEINFTSAMTVIFAINNLNTSGTHAVLGKDEHSLSTSTNLYGIMTSNNAYYFGVGNGSANLQFSSDVTVNEGEWNYVAMTYDSSTGTLSGWVNGIKKSQVNAGLGNIQTNNLDLRIGKYDTASSARPPFEGFIDEIKLYDRVLSDDEIQQEMNVNAIVNPEGIVAYYDFNELSGTTAYDNNHLSTGARQNTSSITDPVFKWDKSINFDGSNDYISVPDDDSISGLNNFSISFFVRRDGENAYNNQKTITKWQGGGNREFIINIRDTTDLLNILTSSDGTNIDVNGDISGFTIPDDSNYYNVILVFDEGLGKILGYKDGVNIGNLSGYNGLFNANANLVFGCDDDVTPVECYNGTLEEVRIYNRSLTNDEVKTIYEGLQNKNFTAEEYLTNDSINNFSIASIYGNKNTTNGLINLNVPYGNISINWTNEEGYYNQTDVEFYIDETEVYTVKANNSNLTIYFNEYVYNDILPQIKLVPVLYPTLDASYAITASTLNTSFIAGNFYADIYIDGSRITRETITINKGDNILNFTDIGINYVYFNDSLTGSPLENSNITIRYPSGIELDLVTDSDGKVNFTTFQSESIEYGVYNITYGGDAGYVSPITFSYNASLLPFNISYEITKTNFNINIYDRISGNLLLNNATVLIEGILENTTTTGNFNISNISISAGTYTVTVSSDGYQTETQIVQYTSQEDLSLDFYLLNQTSPESTTISVRVVDDVDRLVSDATVILKEYDSVTKSYLQVSEGITDSNGVVNFLVELNTKRYKIFASKTIRGDTYEAQYSEVGQFFSNDYVSGESVIFAQEIITLKLSFIGRRDIDPEVYFYYTPTETFNNVTNVSQISVDFYTTDGSTRTVCVEYFIINNTVKQSLTGSQYCLTSSDGELLPETAFALNLDYRNIAEIYLLENGVKTVLKTYTYQSKTSFFKLLFDSDTIKPIMLLFWVGLIAFSFWARNIPMGGILGIILASIELFLFPSLLVASGMVLKTMICFALIYFGRKKEDFT